MPTPREGITAAYHPATNRLIAFGGLPLNDVWILTDANGIINPEFRIDQILPNSGGNSGLVTGRIIGRMLVRLGSAPIFRAVIEIGAWVHEPSLFG
jgi:hypothetical protein